MSQENIQHKNKPDDFTRLFFPETTSDLFFSPDLKGDTDNVELKDILKYLMYGFSATSSGMLVTLLDKEDDYNDAELYSEEKTKPMHPFCSHWRGPCGMRKACKRFDRYIVDLLLEEKSEKPGDDLWQIAQKSLENGRWENQDAVTFECYAGMRDMAYRIRIAGRPFAVLLSGQNPPVLTAENITPIYANLRRLLQRYSANESGANENIAQEFLDEMRKVSSDIPEEQRRESLIKFGRQLEKIFDNLYRDKRRTTEEKILVECLTWCKTMKGIHSTILSKLRDVLGFETIMLFRGLGPLRPERNMKMMESSSPTKNGTIDLQNFWADIRNNQQPILLHDKKWKELHRHFNKKLKLNISDDHPAIVVANDYDPAAVKQIPVDQKSPFLLLAIGENSNLPDINILLRRLLRELESFMDAMESQKQLEDTNNKRDDESKFHEHEIGKSVQNIIEMYSKLKNLASDSDEILRNRWEILRENFKNRVRNLAGIAQVTKAFAEEEYSVPEFDFQFDRKDLVPLIDKSITQYANAGVSRGILVQWKNKPSRPMYSKIDERLLAIAIDEILANAVKYSFADKIVDVTLGPTLSQFWKISIRDFGIRIPQDKLEVVFEPGRRLLLEPEYRGLSIKAERPGSGMGLAYVKTIVENHGGRVLISCIHAKMNPVSDREHLHEVVVSVLVPKM